MLGDSLRAADQQVSEHDLILSVLGGIGHEYDPVVVLVSSQKHSISLQDVQYLLMMHEQRIEQLNGGSQLEIGGASANFVSGDRRNQRGGFNGRNASNRNRGRGRNGGRWYSNARPSCQVCDTGATDHVASDLNNLSISPEFQGNDRLAVGNGQQLQISHIGQSYSPIAAQKNT